MARERNLIGGELEGATLDDELEVRHEDGWFTVKELLLVGDTVCIYYAAPYDDEESSDLRALKELKTRPINDFVRVASTQLQDEDCASVSLGKQVCAFYQGWATKKRKRLEGWFDALIMKRTTVRHSMSHQQEYCGCKFTVQWMDGPHKGKQTRELGCKDICQLSTKIIHTHPVVINIFHRDDAADSAEVNEIIYKHNVKRPRRLKLNESVSADDVDEIAEDGESGELSQLSNVYMDSAPASTVVEVEDLNEVLKPYEVQGQDAPVESDEVEEISELPGSRVPVDNSKAALSLFLHVELASFHDYEDPLTVRFAPDDLDKRCSDGLEETSGFNILVPFGESQAYKARNWRRLRKVHARKAEKRISRSVSNQDVASSATEVERANELTNSALPSLASSSIPVPIVSPLLVPLQDTKEIDGFVPTPVPDVQELSSLEVTKSIGVKEIFDIETQVSQYEDFFDGPGPTAIYKNSGVYASLQPEYSAALEMQLAELRDDTHTRDCVRGDLGSGLEHFDAYNKSLDFHQCRESEECISLLSVLKENSEYVLIMVDNLEWDVEPVEVFDQLSMICNGQVHSVHIPPVSSLMYKKGYVIFTNGDTVEAAVAFLDGETNFVISPGGRPWIFTKADPSELDLDPATVSVYMGAVAHQGRSTDGLQLISACTHPDECLLAKQQKQIFEEHNIFG